MSSSPRLLLVIVGFGASRGMQRVLTGDLLESFDPVSLTLISLALATVIYTAIIALQQGLPRGRKIWTDGLVLGLPNITIPAIAFTACQMYMSAATAALMAATIPIAVAAGASMLGIERANRQILMALTLGFGGVVVIVLGRGGAIGGQNLLIGVLIALIGVVAAASVYVGFGKMLKRHEASALLVPQLITASLTMVVVAVVTRSNSSGMPDVDAGLAIETLILALTNYVLPQLAMFWLIKHTGPTQAAVPSYLAPPIAAGVGWLWLGQQVGVSVLVGGLMILGGAGLMTLEKRRATQRLAREDLPAVEPAR